MRRAVILGSLLLGGCTEPVAQEDFALAVSREYVGSRASVVLQASERALISERFGSAFGESDEHHPVFVLHDTAGAPGVSFAVAMAEEARGPLGLGPAIYVAANGTTRVARPFFTDQRPSATRFQRGDDLLSQKAATSLGRVLWSKASASERDLALDAALAPFEESYPGEPHKLTAAEIAAEQEHATAELAGEGDQLYTAAIWTVEALLALGVGGLTVEQESALAGYLETRRARIGAAVDMELGQVAGHGCASGGKLPPYEDTVYDAAAEQYLRAALLLGRYPSIDTHFAIDAVFDGHCDPRCFDLDRLYDRIAEVMGHAGPVLYGVLPLYGRTWGEATVWWDTATCGSPAPPLR